MSLSGRTSATVEVNPVGKKKVRKRARDEGTVTPIGVEVLTALLTTAERCRVAKKWTKRTLWEEAMRRFLVGEGYDPPPDPTTEEAE